MDRLAKTAMIVSAALIPVAYFASCAWRSGVSLAAQRMVDSGDVKPAVIRADAAPDVVCGIGGCQAASPCFPGFGVEANAPCPSAEESDARHHAMFGHDAKPQDARIVLGEGLVVNGKLPHEVVIRVVRQNVGRFRSCFNAGLARNPVLAGRISVAFIIDARGEPHGAAVTGATLPDVAVRECVVNAFNAIAFPAPESGSAKVVYPLVFNPAGM